MSPPEGEPKSIVDIVPPKNVVVDGVLRYPSTGLKALIVGAGTGGLLTALECWRKGIDVEVIEKADKISALGDIFAAGPSGLATIKNYPTMLLEYEEIGGDPANFFSGRDGVPMMPPMEFEWNRDGAEQNGCFPLRVKAFFSRRALSEMFYKQCKRLGIPITFGVTIEKYEEDIANGNASAIATDGRRFTSELIIAADGLGTKSHIATLGRPVKAVKTGFVVHRGMYSAERLRDAPVMGEYIRNLKRPVILIYTAHKNHCVFSITKSWVSIGITSEGDDTATESWSSTISNDAILASLDEPETWDPRVREFITYAPENSIIRWSLCFRDPQPRWTSTGGRIVQLGDSAHSFLPTSGNGATQALEDAASLAECLRLAGKDNVAVGTKVHQLLRYQRVSLIQRTGFVNMQYFHREVDKNDKLVEPPLRMGKWLWTHNPEKYATENFAKARDHLEKGTPFENTNLPLGHKWSDWTMEEEFAKQKAGIVTKEELNRNGDWSM
ncbi:hypothetical protein M426DRAFT_159593 [Hypoxylon sp. CI-4A]|nr:hypothetical protein M426DRAFT_159593 [Hypoxylon sp. CI-4A]